MKLLLVAAGATFTLALASCGDSSTKLNTDESNASAASMGGAAHAVVLDMSSVNVAKGKACYQANCAVCHGSGGKGDGPAAVAMTPKPRNHCNGDYMDKLSNEHICNVIKMGGATYGFPTMPAQPQLSDGDVKAVVAFIRTLSPTFKP